MSTSTQCKLISVDLLEGLFDGIELTVNSYVKIGSASEFSIFGGEVIEKESPTVEYVVVEDVFLSINNKPCSVLESLLDDDINRISDRVKKILNINIEEYI